MIRRMIVGATLLVVALVVVFGLRARQAECAAIPLLSQDVLPNAALIPAAGARMPEGWSAGAAGVELRGPAMAQGDAAGFELDGDGRSLQLIGIGNFIQTPPVAVHSGQTLCFVGKALTDSGKGSATRLQVIFEWLDAGGQALESQPSDWQPVALWTAGLADWSTIRASATAPEGASTLRVRLRPASDDRVYLDAMHLRLGGLGSTVAGSQQGQEPGVDPQDTGLTLLPWPNGAQAAVSFSFDWETAMGGLVHSRSVDDPNASQDPMLRAMRMREGVTTTLDLFSPYGIGATYYANGYNFLQGNTERRTFMSDPTFAWATAENGWSDTWKTTPWFALDPYGSLQSDPGWYFGDLVPRLLASHQDIQSHTFSHFSGRYADAAAWDADLEAWRTTAAEQGVAPARSLAFPWSSSAGLSDADWAILEHAGITSVTRTNWSQPQFRLVDRAAPRCAMVPGHMVLACPDFYLIAGRSTSPDDAIARAYAGGGPDDAIAQIDRAIGAGGMVDIWAHTEEVTSSEQIAAWERVVGYAAQRRDAGAVWIAPLATIADWQMALGTVRIARDAAKSQEGAGPVYYTITNDSQHDLSGLTVQTPFSIRQAGAGATLLSPTTLVLPSLPAGQQLEVAVWPA